VFRIHQNVEIIHQCVYCAAIFNSVAKLKEHRKSHQPRTDFQVYQSAHRQKCVIWRKIFREEKETIEQAFNEVKVELFKLLGFELVQRKNIKTSICYHVEFLKTDDDRQIRFPMCLRGPSKLLVSDADIKDMVFSSKRIADQRVDDLIHNGSGWALDCVLFVDVELVRAFKL
jgi:hypothetical protein